MKGKPQKPSERVYSNRTFAKRLCLARQDAGMSQSDLGRASDITIQAIHKFEKGKSCVTVETAFKLAVALDVSVDYLIGISDETKNISWNKVKPIEVNDQ